LLGALPALREALALRLFDVLAPRPEAFDVLRVLLVFLAGAGLALLLLLVFAAPLLRPPEALLRLAVAPPRPEEEPPRLLVEEALEPEEADPLRLLLAVAVARLLDVLLAGVRPALRLLEEPVFVNWPLPETVVRLLREPARSASSFTWPTAISVSRSSASYSSSSVSSNSSAIRPRFNSRA
jgi:hypothetical protein